MPAGSSSERPASRPGPATAASATNPLPRRMPPDQLERETTPAPAHVHRPSNPGHDRLAVCRRQLFDEVRELVLVEPVNSSRRGGELKGVRRTSNDVQPLPVDRPTGQLPRKRVKAQPPSERARSDVDRDQPELAGVLDELDVSDAS